MRPIALAVSTAVILMLAPAASAGATDLPSHRVPGGRPSSAAVRPAPQAPSDRFFTLGASLAGGAVVTGHVYDFDGSPIDGAPVAWSVATGGTYESGSTSAGPDGVYTFSGLPAAAGTGELLASSPAQPWSIGRFDATWPDPGQTTFDFRPGVITTSITRGGPWAGWSDVWAYVYGSDAISSVAGMSTISGTSPTVTGDTWAMPGTYADGAVYFWMDEGIEFTTSAAVAGGARSGQTISVDQSLAQRVMVTQPYWASGKPGSVVKIRHEGFPGAWTLDYVGFSDSPAAPTVRTLGSLITTGTSTFTKTVTIPTRAPAGYFYYLEAQHREGPLAVDAPFQVCTLNASKNSVRKGGEIKLRGVVPTEGHLGPDPGQRKWVTVYKRTRYVSGPPKAWDPTRSGWTEVARIQTDRFGKYSRYLKPSRTTWYVVRYPADDWYWRAYTSVLKVRVY